MTENKTVTVGKERAKTYLALSPELSASPKAVREPGLILLGGKKRAGKDTFAEFLKKDLEAAGYEVDLMGMSDPLLKALLVLDPFIELEDPYVPSRSYERFSSYYARKGCDYTEVKTNKEVRGLLQRLGTDLVRDMINENAWTEIADRRIEENLQKGRVSILTGIRFPNELAIGERRGGLSYYIERPELEIDGETSSSPETSGHISEHSLEPSRFLYTVYNSGSLGDLEALAGKEARRVLEGLKGA